MRDAGGSGAAARAAPVARRSAAAVLAAAAALAPAAAAPAAGEPPRGAAGPPRAAPPGLPPDLPLDRAGVPTRPLTDAELHRLLVAMSATNGPAALLLALCRGAGTPFGHPGWRACIEDP